MKILNLYYCFKSTVAYSSPNTGIVVPIDEIDMIGKPAHAKYEYDNTEHFHHLKYSILEIFTF